MPTSDKAYKTSCSFPAEQAEWIREQLADRGESGTSALLQNLVQAAMDNSLPAGAEDPHFLERIIRTVRSERSRRFGRLWAAHSDALSPAERAEAYSQGEVAGALFDSFLNAIEQRKVNPVINRAFAVLPAGPWDALLEAARAGDIQTIRVLLRQFDQSGTAAMYQFPEPRDLAVAEPGTMTLESEKARFLSDVPACDGLALRHERQLMLHELTAEQHERVAEGMRAFSEELTA